MRVAERTGKARLSLAVDEALVVGSAPMPARIGRVAGANLIGSACHSFASTTRPAIIRSNVEMLISPNSLLLMMRTTSRV